MTILVLGIKIFGRVPPGVRTMVSVPARITRMCFALFFGTSFGGAYVGNTLLVGVCFLLGFKLTLSQGSTFHIVFTPGRDITTGDATNVDVTAGFPGHSVACV